MCEELKIIFTGFIGGLCGSMGVYLLTLLRDYTAKSKDKETVLLWLLKHSADEDGMRWHSTKTIASWNDLTIDRVKQICCMHEAIRLSVKPGEKEMWGLKSIVGSTPPVTGDESKI